jgi:hypothetical protein
MEFYDLKGSVFTRGVIMPAWLVTDKDRFLLYAPDQKPIVDRSIREAFSEEGQPRNISNALIFREGGETYGKHFRPCPYQICLAVYDGKIIEKGKLRALNKITPTSLHSTSSSIV